MAPLPSYVTAIDLAEDGNLFESGRGHWWVGRVPTRGNARERSPHLQQMVWFLVLPTVRTSGWTPHHLELLVLPMVSEETSGQGTCHLEAHADTSRNR